MSRWQAARWALFAIPFCSCSIPPTTTDPPTTSKPPETRPEVVATHPADVLAPSDLGVPASASTATALVEPKLPVRWIPPTSMGLSPEGNPLPLLPRFFSSLLQLAKGERSRHVRIAWLGDSHTQPDIWTHAVRVPLQQRFGVGGPGFVHVGWNKWGYRSAGADLSVEGTWRIEPPRLLSVKAYDDAVLGLGGVRLVAPQGSRAIVKSRLSALPGAARWDLALRFPSDGLVRVVPSTGEAFEVLASPESPGVRHVSWVTEGPGGGFSVEVLRGPVQFFGVVVESEEPGVVMDVLGLNGARAVHALAWSEAAWNEALARRSHDLAVLAYGTNEAGIRDLSMEGHRAELVALVDRIRAASPDADCWIVGAMDRGGPQTSEKIERINEAQEAAAKDRGCAFWSAQKAMGGRGSMQKWLEQEPPMATPDRVHLHVRGYRRLGGMIARDLLRAYDEGGAADP